MTTVLISIGVVGALLLLTGFFLEMYLMRKKLESIEEKHAKEFSKRKLEINDEHINRAAMTKAITRLDKRVSENNNLLLRFLSKK